MLRMDGKLQCASRYLDRCLGKKRIAEVRQEGECVYLVFEDGHQLPLLCGCCGEPLEFKGVEALERRYKNRRLLSFSDAREGTSYDDVWPVVVLTFSGVGELPGIAWESAARIHHPPDCPARRRKRAKSAAGARTRKRRKRRR